VRCLETCPIHYRNGTRFLRESFNFHARCPTPKIQKQFGNFAFPASVLWSLYPVSPWKVCAFPRENRIQRSASLFFKKTKQPNSRCFSGANHSPFRAALSSASR